ncbi:NAD(P)H oxidoreductase [Kitasatospora sp. NPDC058201]|uniref:NAD(P)H oxidoreductase n=1 Tax=unclassified Kitasatospora TaxID=2633591 RepID=UPI0036568358
MTRAVTHPVADPVLALVTDPALHRADSAARRAGEGGEVSGGALPEGRRPQVLLVLAHPRPDSLTAQVAARAADRFAAAGYRVDLFDLHAEGFDPRMTPEDEPDWQHRDKTYSADVRAHMRRIEAADVIVPVFPLWWFGPPAVLKGWIDRVWNYGFAYGRSRPGLAAKRMLWLGLSSYPAAEFAELGWDVTVTRLLKAGISEFCGITDASVVLLHDSLAAGGRVLDETDRAIGALLAPAPVG